MEIRKILVPLDATEFAERAIATAQVIAEQRRASLEFATVYEPELQVTRPSGAPVPDPRLDRGLRDGLRDYLERVATVTRSRTTVPVVARLLEGDVVRSLDEEVEREGIDLVVMTTRRRGGLERLFTGSVADRLIRSIHVPVFLVGGHEDGATPAVSGIRRVVVALGGNEADERVLDTTLSITNRERTAYTLLHVASYTRIPPALVGAPTPPDELAALPPTVDQAEMTAAEAYLTRLAAPLRKDGVAVDVQVEIGRTVPEAIVDHAERTSADLIALATRAPGGLERALLGSVADKVMRSAKTSVLVCPPAKS